MTDKLASASEWKQTVEDARAAIVETFLPRIKEKAGAGRGLASISIPDHLHPNHRSTQLNFRDYGDLLEAEWPGCSVMWDAHPELSQWHRYAVCIVENYLTNRPWTHRDIGTERRTFRRHRREIATMMSEARKHGPLMLVAYPFQPPTWKAAMIAAEIVIDDDRWAASNDPVSPYRQTVLVPIRAIYTASETRWTVVR
jgi:hypothetical protein